MSLRLELTQAKRLGLWFGPTAYTASPADTRQPALAAGSCHASPSDPDQPSPSDGPCRRRNFASRSPKSAAAVYHPDPTPSRSAERPDTTEAPTARPAVRPADTHCRPPASP